MLTVGSLFAGIGGFDLGLERAGMQVKWQVEIDHYCLKVLEKHWPHVRRYTDIKQVDWSGVEPVDLVCGGFPCQPVSVAGKRKGTADERWLWPEFAKCLRVLRPRYVILENVPGLLTGNGGHAFREVCDDLSNCGYEFEWQIISAADMGAPHLRKRVWIVAYAGLPESPRWNEATQGQQPVGRWASRSEPASRGDLANTTSLSRNESLGLGINRRQDETEQVRVGSTGTIMAHPAFDGRTRSGDTRTGRDGLENGGTEISDTTYGNVSSRRNKPQSVAEEGDDRETSRSGFLCFDTGQTINQSNWWTTEPNVGRVAHGVPARVDRLRALGNAIVPQCAEFIGRRILEWHSANTQERG